MRKIIYYVASSLDGYIMGENEDMSVWVQIGNGITQYLQDLQDFDTVLMGRKTYEFGYKFGMKAGNAPYPNLQNCVFSDTLQIADLEPNVLIYPMDITIVQDLKKQAGKDIYLCGGGKLAEWLLAHGQIDILKIKLNPLLLGKGIRLFGDSTTEKMLELLDSNLYENGLHILTYQFKSI